MYAPDQLPPGSRFSGYWCLKDSIVFLNHGSFGACPRAVMKERSELLSIIEGDPMEFLLERHQPMLRQTLSRIEAFTGAEPGSMAMVENATTGINTVLRNLKLKQGESVLVSDQEYFSSSNALRTVAQKEGANAVTVELPYPVPGEDSILDAFARALNPSVKYALVDHIVSSTGMILPLKKIITLLGDFGVETIVDGAHGPGQVPLNLRELGCLAYTGNCHKWLCSPRSAALLYVRPDFQEGFQPLVISHLPEEFDTDLSDFQVLFSWNGTPDPTPALMVPHAIDHMKGMVKGGWPSIMSMNREKAIAGRNILCDALGAEPPCPDSMVGSMAAVTLPGTAHRGKRPVNWTDPVQKRLKEEFRAIVPVTEIKGGELRIVRISAQLYNSREQYSWLADSLRSILGG